MAAAPAHSFFSAYVYVYVHRRPLLLPPSPPAARRRRGARPGCCSSFRPSTPASSETPPTMPASDLDSIQRLQQRRITDVRETLRACRRRSGGREMAAAVDNLKRLCIDHHFEEEIGGQCAAMVDACMDLVHSDSLLDATLAFRLIREAGYHLSADDVLRKFTNSAGEFSPGLSKDTMGLLSLHDVSHLNMGDEASLYEAKDFSARHLAAAISGGLLEQQPGLAVYVRQSLDHPYHLSLMQYKARHHLRYLQTLPPSCCRDDATTTAAMEELAAAEFQLNKAMHQREIQEIKRWWMNLGLAQEVPVARDQVLKWYTWSMTILQGSNSFSRYRVEITKIISIAYVVDDVFDLVGTLEELSLFTRAVKMWDTAAADSLPSCMRACYRALYTVTNEMADMAEKEHGFNPIHHLRKAWAVLCDGFMVEARWLATDQVPSAEEYLRNGVITSGVPFAFVSILFLLGHRHHAAGISDDAAELTDHHIPPAISSAAKILRLWDDMGSAKDEAQEGLDGSYRDLYLMENPGGDAEEHMRRLIAREWEQLNRECFSRRSGFSASFAQTCLNAARMVSVMYTYDKEQRLPVLDDYMRMLLL